VTDRAAAASLYAIEHAVLDPVARRFRSVTELRAYLDDLVGSDWFGARWPDQAVPGVERRGRGAVWSLASRERNDMSDDGTIRLTTLDLATVLHELAHLCCGIDCGHDDRFVATLLALVRHEMGAHAYGTFLAAVTADRRWPFVADELEALAR
jgi:putative metallohydrolase (TIGR04338 family)